MKVLITGATGLVGRAMVELCLSNDIGVHYLTTKKRKLVSQENHHGFYWNPNKNEIDIACFKGVDVIINLAGASITKRWTKRNRNIILNSRVNSLRTLRLGLEELQDHTVTKLVSASAIGIYPSSLTDFYKEDEKNSTNEFLGKVVQAWEKEVDTFAVLGVNTVKLRIGLVLSNKGGALPKIVKPIRNFVGAPFGSGEQWQSWIHINDLAQLFLFAAKTDINGVFNAVAPNPVTNSKMTKAVATAVSMPILMPNIPKLALQVLLGKMHVLLVDSHRVSSKKIQKKGFDFQYQNITMALQDLYPSVKKQTPIL